MRRCLPLLLVCAVRLAAGQGLVFDKAVHDFGRISTTAPVTATFTARNAGTSPLVLRDVQTSCGCTSALPDRTLLAPGAETTLRVAFDPHKDYGPVEKVITLLADGAQPERHQLTIRAEVLPPVYLDKPVVFFSDVLRGEQPGEDLVGATFTGRRLAVRGVEAPAHLRAVATQAGDRVALRVTLLTEAIPAGQRDGQDTVLLRTDAAEMPEVALKVYWHLGEAVTAQPARVMFDLAKAGQRLETGVVLRQARGRAFRVTGWKRLEGKGAVGAFSVEGLSAPAATTQTLRVVVDAATPPGLHTARLAFLTDDPAMPEVQVEVMAMLNPR